MDELCEKVSIQAAFESIDSEELCETVNNDEDNMMHTRAYVARKKKHVCI